MNLTDIEIPVAPAGVVVLINLFAPYLVSLVLDIKWPTNAKKIVSLVSSALIAGIALTIYYLISGESVPAWPSLIILGVVVTQTSYAVFLKDSADQVTATTGTGAKSNVIDMKAYVDAKVQAGIENALKNVTMNYSIAAAPSGPSQPSAGTQPDPQGAAQSAAAERAVRDAA